MVRLAFDENFNNDVLRGLLRRSRVLDFIRIQDTRLRGGGDEAVLEWAAVEGRVLVSHDVTTLTGFAYERLARKQRMPGLIAAGSHLQQEAPLRI